MPRLITECSSSTARNFPTCVTCAHRVRTKAYCRLLAAAEVVTGVTTNATMEEGRSENSPCGLMGRLWKEETK